MQLSILGIYFVPFELSHLFVCDDAVILQRKEDANVTCRFTRILICVFVTSWRLILSWARVTLASRICVISPFNRIASALVECNNAKSCCEISLSFAVDVDDAACPRSMPKNLMFPLISDKPTLIRSAHLK